MLFFRCSHCPPPAVPPQKEKNGCKGAFFRIRGVNDKLFKGKKTASIGEEKKTIEGDGGKVAKNTRRQGGAAGQRRKRARGNESC